MARHARTRLTAVVLTLLALTSPVAANPLAKELFGAETRGSPHKPAPFGGYSTGCIAGAAQLPETGPTWQAMRLGRNRNWGHPEAIAFVERLSAHAATLPGWSGLYVGDISQPRGGPMLTGHASHQSGLDIDIWMRPATRLDLSRGARETLSSISVRRAEGAYVNENWTRRITRSEAGGLGPGGGADLRLPRRQGADVPRRDRRPGLAEKDQAVVGASLPFSRAAQLPAGAAACEDQTPPPAGDGCADAAQWVANILNPPPPDPNAPPPAPRRELVLADLPRQCAQILSR